MDDKCLEFTMVSGGVGLGGYAPVCARSGHRSQRAVSAGDDAEASSRGYSAAVVEDLTGPRQSALYRQIERVTKHALRAMRPRREPAADLVGDVAARALLTLRRWRAECGLGTWVYGIARNELVRREQAELRTAARIEAMAREPPSASVPTPEDLLAVGERCCELARALARLSFKRRISLLGLDVWEMSAEAVASVLGAKAGAVRVSARKARVQLGWLLAQMGEGRPGSAVRETCGFRLNGGRCRAPVDGWLSCRRVVPVGLADRLLDSESEKTG